MMDNMRDIIEAYSCVLVENKMPTWKQGQK